MNATRPMRSASPLIKLILPAMLAIAAVLWLPLAAQQEKVREADKELKSSRSRLEEIEGEIKATEGKAQQLQKQEKSLVNQLRDVEVKIDHSRSNLKKINGEIKDLNAEITFLNNRLASLSRDLARKKAIRYRRLREIYKRGRLHTVQVLLESHSFTDFLQRIKFLTLIADQDRRLVRQVVDIQRAQKEYRAERERNLALMIERREELEAEQKNLEASEKRRKGLLASVKKDRQAVLKILEQRKADRQRMLDLIAEIERRRQEALERARREGRTLPPEVAYLEGRMGNLPWPVARGRVLRGFGPYTDKTTKTTVINNGLEISAPQGEEVRAVAAGTVVMATRFRTYGITVTINHGSHMYTTYAHLGDIFVREGDSVSEGQAIASVGESGSLQGPMLYFELRDGAKAVNPRTWLGRQ